MANPRPQFSVWNVDGLDIKTRHRVESNDEDTEIDPNFFDEDYNMAVATGGLKVWDGARCLFDYMVNEESKKYFFEGSRMLELGSGSGMLAMALAAKGAHVLATDTRHCVDDMIRPSVLLNSKNSVDFWCSPPGFSAPVAVSIGTGSVACERVDWRKPLPTSLTSIPESQHPHFIVASEVVWLRELATPYLTCVRRCLESYPSAEGIMSFPVRGLDEDQKSDSDKHQLFDLYCGRKYFEEEARKCGVKLTAVAEVPPTPKQDEEGVFGTMIYKMHLLANENTNNDNDNNNPNDQ